MTQQFHDFSPFFLCYDLVCLVQTNGYFHKNAIGLNGISSVRGKKRMKGISTKGGAMPAIALASETLSLELPI